MRVTFKTFLSRIAVVKVIEFIEHPMAVIPDPRKMTKANMYYSQTSRNGKLYNIEILYDSIENKISHFMYDSDALGPLEKIRK
jgi:hypothetical protein